LKESETNRAFDRPLQLSSCERCQFIEAVQTERMQTWQRLGVVDCF